jgi:hypothetical protein
MTAAPARAGGGRARQAPGAGARRAHGARRAGPLAALVLLAAGGLALPTGGCGFNSVQTTTCRTDDQCASGFACAGGACIQRGVPRGAWAVELVPSSDSTSATTELPSVSFTEDVTVLVADAKVTVTGGLAAGSSFYGASHVVATVQPLIPGRPDRQFETEWSAPVGSAPPPNFSLAVPSSTIGATATMTLVPLPPRDQAQPPVSLQITLAPTMALTPSNDFLFLTGRLVSAVRVAQSGYVARALQDGQLISNVDTIGTVDNGQFRLAIPASAATYAGTGQAVTVELAPSDANATAPRFTTRAVSATNKPDLGDITLPAYGSANLFRLVIIDPQQQPVSGALVHLRTVLSNDGTGSAVYQRDGTSDASGVVDLALLPGTSQGSRPYDISVVPSPGSPFGVACFAAYPIDSGLPTLDPSQGDPPVAATLSLPAKAQLTGTILSADGVAVSGVTISVSRTTADPTCPDGVVSPSASATSDRSGSYQLLVDPGVYRIDYSPPAGAPVPRLTETGVTVPAGGILGRVVQMLPGALLTGIVRDTSGTPLPFAGVRFFDVVCSGTDACFGRDRVEPLLLAETHSGGDGNFRAVIPLQLAPP